MTVLIEASELSKRYRKGSDFGLARLSEVAVGLTRSARAWLRRTSTPTADVADFWALRNVNLTVREGEVVGVIGHNGAGKSTLLKILTRIVHPTRGSFTIRGRVASLLEVGTGFHPELTGRENVYLSGCILGLTRREVRERFDEIVAFSGVEAFLDTPLKRYSSGMQVRLGFAVAAHLDAEIMILDEALAVGDAAFQWKCQAKIEEIRNSGRTILLVSHSMPHVVSICHRVIWLDGGQVREEGDPADLVERYLTQASAKMLSDQAVLPANESLRVTRLTLTQGDDRADQSRLVEIERTCDLSIEFEVLKPDTVIEVRAALKSTQDMLVFANDSPRFTSRDANGANMRRVTCRIPGNLLGEHEYFFRLVLSTPTTGEALVMEPVLPFRACFASRRQESGSHIMATGIVHPTLTWKCESATDAPICQVAKQEG